MTEVMQTVQVLWQTGVKGYLCWDWNPLLPGFGLMYNNFCAMCIVGQSVHLSFERQMVDLKWG